MNNNVLAIIVAFYLSKYNREGLEKLNFKTFNDAFEETAKSLNVKKNYVKLRRDEFDYVFPWREGWKRPMAKRIIRAIEILDDLEEPDIRDIIKQILIKPSYRNSDELKDIIDIIKNTDEGNVASGRFILRCPTGKAAEDFFYKFYQKNKLPIEGELIDCRDLGCGYDYKIVDAQFNEIYVEVKGLSDISGGILFTNKEWKTATKEKERYYVCLIKSINNEPKIEFINNPTNILKPVKNIRTTIQINWTVSDKELQSIHIDNNI